jgi:hypothetical protein
MRERNLRVLVVIATENLSGRSTKYHGGERLGAFQKMGEAGISITAGVASDGQRTFDSGQSVSRQ